MLFNFFDGTGQLDWPLIVFRFLWGEGFWLPQLIEYALVCLEPSPIGKVNFTSDVAQCASSNITGYLVVGTVASELEWNTTLIEHLTWAVELLNGGKWN